MELDFSTITTASSDSWDIRVRNDGAKRFRKHYASGNYQRSSSSHRGKGSRGGIKATLLDQPVCGIDGEGMTWPNGTHHYTTFQAHWPTGRNQIKGLSLGTKQCLDFLLNLPEHHTVVIYGGSYDMNMWLRDLPRCQSGMCHRCPVCKLLDAGKTQWMGYQIHWIERKF